MKSAPILVITGPMNVVYLRFDVSASVGTATVQVYSDSYRPSDNDDAGKAPIVPHPHLYRLLSSMYLWDHSPNLPTNPGIRPRYGNFPSNPTPGICVRSCTILGPVFDYVKSTSDLLRVRLGMGPFRNFL